MPQKPLDMSRRRVRLCAKANKKPPRGLRVWLFALLTRRREARVKRNVE